MASPSEALPVSNRLARYNTVFIAAALVAIVALMVMPVPPMLLDALIACNIAASVGLLLLAVHVNAPVALSTFPTLVLCTTLLRLALNVASSRSILLNAEAGHIIETFGRMVVGGNVVVGLVVFVVITIVQLIVVAKGAERVAEVAARFTLDAMPGKQMSIDADLRAGMLDKREAVKRRRSLERESQMHGAMDGAMKFVKGDAIATLLIALVNIVGGIAVGAAMHGMPLAEAVDRYTLLTVGDGMVTQIPSLLVCMAAGLLTTRVGGDNELGLGAEIIGQVAAQPVAVLLTGLLVCGFVAVPGFPQAQFLLLGSAIAAVGWLLRRELQRSISGAHASVPAMGVAGSPADHPVLIEDCLPAFTVPALVRMAPDVASRLDPDRLGEELGNLRQRLLETFGLPFPGLRLIVDPTLSPGAYRLFANDVFSGAGQMEPGTAAGDRMLVKRLGELVQGRPQEFFGVQETQRLLLAAETEWADLMRELGKSVPLLRVTDVLRRLLQEGIPIRNMRAIAESLLQWAPKEKDAVMLAEYVRLDLGPWIVARQVDDSGSIPALVIHPDLELRWKASIQHNPCGSFLAIAPEERGRFCQALTQFAPHPDEARQPALVTTMELRRYVRSALETEHPRMQVLSFEEIGSHAPLEVLGTVSI